MPKLRLRSFHEFKQIFDRTTPQFLYIYWHTMHFIVTLQW